MSESNPPAQSGATATSAHYDRVAGAWRLLMGDDLHYGWFSAPDEPLAVATANLTERLGQGAKISPEHLVLDVGCGVGGPARYLAQRYGCRVLGISTSAVGVTWRKRWLRPWVCSRVPHSKSAMASRPAAPASRSIASGFSSRRT